MSDNSDNTQNGITRREFVKYTAGTMVVLSAGGLLTSCASSDNGTPASSGMVFGSLHPVSDHPVVKELSTLAVEVTDGAHNARHGLALDGAKMTPGEVAASTLVRDQILGEKALLLLNCSGAHKQALATHIGISIGTDASLAYCVIPVAGSRGRKMAIHDHPRANVPNIADLIKADIQVDEALFLSNQEKFRHDVENVSGPKAFAAAIRKELDANVKLRATLPLKAASRVQAANGDTSGLASKKWTYSQNTSWRYDNMIPGGDPTPWIIPAPAPNQGYQAGCNSSTTTITLYLDNTNVNGDFQWLTVDHLGGAYPRVDCSVDLAKTSVAMPRDGQEFTYSYNDPVNGPAQVSAKSWGYAQMAYAFTFTPSFSNPGSTLFYKDAQPPNTNDVKTYESGYSIDVGVSKEGPDVGFTIEHSSTTEIHDWTVENKTNPSTFNYAWDWNSTNPQNTSAFESMNKLNTWLFAPEAFCVMRTHTLLFTPLTFEMNYGVSQISMNTKCVFAPDATIHWKYYNERKDIGACMYSAPVTIDFGSVLSPVLESLFVPVAGVKGGTATTGTVTLDLNAPTGGTTVYLSSSNSTWASVPASVVVPAGVASQTFPITTFPISGNPSVIIKASLTTDPYSNAILTASMPLTS
jgi:hypothetical protein